MMRTFIFSHQAMHKAHLLRHLALAAFFTALQTFSLSAQEAKVIQYRGSSNYILRERTDLRCYKNGRYIGLTSREISSFIVPVPSDGGYLYEGNFYINQKTQRDSSLVGFTLNDSIPSVFRIEENGSLNMVEDNGFPTFRGFPSYSNQKVKIGDSWEAKAVRAVDPLNKGVITRMPIYVRYIYSGDDFFHDQEVYLITAQWATRYGMGSGTSYIDWGGDQDLDKATGAHTATIIVSKESGNALVVHDSVDETFFYTDGNYYQFKGTISLFTEYPPAIDRSKLIHALNRIASAEDLEKIEKTEKKRVAVASTGTGTNSGSGTGSSTIAKLSPSHTGTSSTDTKTSSPGAKPLSTGAQQPSSVAKTLSPGIEPSSTVTKTSSPSPEKISVSETPAGLMLTIEDLHFEPDSARLLQSEDGRLDKIAQVLQQVPETKLLIEGHTASTGRAEGEMKLSLERSHAIAQALAERGVASGRFICKGSGGKKPVADNSTSEGKAKNRRVEITILN